MNTPALNPAGTAPQSARRIRVLQLGSPTGLYGAERWILALVRHLDRDEFHSIVSVIKDGPGLDAPVCAEAARDGIDTFVIEAHGKVNWSAVRQLREYILRERIDIVHGHGYKTDLIAVLAARGTACKTVTTPHGWSAQQAWKLRVYEALDRASFRFFDAVVPLSQDLYDELHGRSGVAERLHLITNGVDISEIDAVTAVDAQIAAWRAEGKLIIGYIGQLIPRKCLSVLLSAYAHWRPPNAKLVLVGEGELRSELTEQARQLGIDDDVLFAGYRADRLQLLKGFDVFVLASRLEGIPRCLMESMAAGVPIIGANIPGTRDAVAHEKTGLLFELDDVDALTQCLRRMSDPAVRQRFAIAGRNAVLEQFSAAAMARKYAALYRALLRK